MKIYEIKPDPLYQAITCIDDQFKKVPFYKNDRLGDFWGSFSFSVVNPQLKKGDFMFVMPGYLCCRRYIMMMRDEYLHHEFTDCAEHLPGSLAGANEELTFLNVNTYINCLNRKTSEFTINADGYSVSHIKKYNFYHERIDTRLA